LNLLEPIVDVVLNQQTTDCDRFSTAEGAR
jgi:hypothetical protein